MSALKTLAQWARMLGLIAWTPEVKRPRTEGYRDTRGPGSDGWEAMLAAVREAADAGDIGAIRDHAIVRMLHDLGLRRGELCALDLEDLDQQAGTVAVIGKGRTQKQNHTLPEPTIKALASWLGVRGQEPGPLFFGLDNRSKGTTRLAGESVRRIVAALGEAAGVGRPVRPHGLRHQAITSVLERTNGNLEYGMKFARHANPRTTMAYNDNRRDVAGEMARLVAGDS
jgi:integrase/recombinase XerC